MPALWTIRFRPDGLAVARRLRRKSGERRHDYYLSDDMRLRYIHSQRLRLEQTVTHKEVADEPARDRQAEIDDATDNEAPND